MDAFASNQRVTQDSEVRGDVQTEELTDTELSAVGGGAFPFIQT
jgi:hypothetical protein